MCLTVITPDGRWLHSVRDIEAEPWGVQFTYADVVAGDDEDDNLTWRDFCLCGIDAYAALDRAGVTYREEDGFLLIVTCPRSGLPTAPC